MPSEAECIINLYQRHAEEWDKERGRSLMEKSWLDRFLALLPPDAFILDIGCGSAEPLARYFIEQGKDVTGIDASPALIAICRNRFPAQQWIVADMRLLSLEQRFNGIVAWDSFFHLSPDDQRQIFPIFRNQTAPRVALMFTSGPAHGEAIGTYKKSRFIMGAWTEPSTAYYSINTASMLCLISWKIPTAAIIPSGWHNADRLPTDSF